MDLSYFTVLNSLYSLVWFNKHCRTCAHEYERRHEMAAAALAFKCMEVAYMKIIYYNNSIISRDRHELETTLQAVHPGNKFLNIILRIISYIIFVKFLFAFCPSL